MTRVRSLPSDGATAAFLLNPPPVAGDPFERAMEIGASLAEAVRRVRLPKAVVLSSVGAQHASGTGIIATLHQIEAALAGTAPATAFLRSVYFVETWTDVAESAVADGTLPTFLEPDQKIPMVSTVDVGRAAARLLREDWKPPRRGHGLCRGSWPPGRAVVHPAGAAFSSPRRSRSPHGGGLREPSAEPSPRSIVHYGGRGTRLSSCGETVGRRSAKLLPADRGYGRRARRSAF